MSPYRVPENPHNRHAAHNPTSSLYPRAKSEPLFDVLRHLDNVRNLTTASGLKMIGTVDEKQKQNLLSIQRLDDGGST